MYLGMIEYMSTRTGDSSICLQPYAAYISARDFAQTNFNSQGLLVDHARVGIEERSSLKVEGFRYAYFWTFRAL